ncbi:hypothetical protein [Schinkia azotoformans]|uniref:hypothetical protein n=1 Tax=Schinkia azotoformans TaxID=1454 RepID=UPI002DBFD471|nr:hypothetical protein [Schinkia azotoformans]MEC1714743.1 hypothetical protein [Schinkia azotoformans]MEC1757501.1 hypothetical protein [Schinkia azotoformans]
MNPSLKQQLKKWNQQHQESTPKKKTSSKKPQKAQEERLSEHEWKDIMGTNMTVLRRGKGGAWRNGR